MTTDQLAPAASHLRPTYRQQAIDLPGRVRLAFVERGAPGGVPVLFLHGLSDSWRSFEFMLECLPDTIHAFALTLRGHGDAGKPETGYLPGDFADDVAGFMDAMDIGAAVVVGHSLGSLIAQRFAIDHPDRVLGLVLLGAVRSFRGIPGIDELHAAFSSLEDPVDPGFVREFQLSTITQPVPPAFVDAVVEESLKLPAGVWRAIADSFLDDDTYRGVGAISVPTLLIWGDQDSVTPRAEQDRLVSELAGSRLVTYVGTGHAIHWEQPARVASDVVAFVDGQVSRARETAG